MGESSGAGARWGRAPMAAVAPLDGNRPAVVGGGTDGAAGEERWRHFDSSVSAVSFGFVATAILIAMFLLMAIFERFLQPRPGSPFSPSQGGASRRWLLRFWGGAAVPEAEVRRSSGRQGPQGHFAGKQLGSCVSPKMPVYAKEVSVMMPGQDVPTFIAHPVPAPCPREGIAWPCHHQTPPASNPS